MAIKVDNISNINSYQNVKSKVAFIGEQAPVDLEQQPDTFKKEGSQQSKKVGIGLASVIGLVAAGFGIKKYMNYRTLTNAAKAVGLEDTKLYKQMQEMFGKVTKHDGEKLEIKDLLAKIDKFSEKGILKEGDKYVLMPPQMTQECFGKKYNGATLPKNAVAVMIKRNDNGTKILCREIILNKGLAESLLRYPQDKLIVFPIKL